ncbi:MAG: Gfo/Idh/MocA family oxidoreductase [Candidatus Omnitrophica bacterium]|nr:Gfo/Idh/MocA family oxidoreductase [Candidatus Omnitrophota bacterium]
MKNRKVRIIFVGVGSMGQCAHLKNYVLIPDCEVVAICEIRENLGKKVMERYGIKNFYKNFDDLIEKEDFDGIVASQPFTRHYVILKEILKAKKPVFIEKPLASSVEIGEKILEMVKKAKTFLMVGYHKRSDLASIYVKNLVDKFKNSEEIGKLKYIRITMPPGDWIQGGFKDLITTDEKLPENIEFDPKPENINEEDFREYIDFVNYYIHQVNFMRFLFGEDYKVKFADKSKILMVVESNSGIPGIIEMAPYKTSFTWEEKILICFEYGYIELSLPAPLASNISGKVKIYKDKPTPQTIIPQFPPISAMYQQSINFIKAIKGEIKPPVDAEEALKDLKIAKEYFDLLKN